MIRPEGDGYQLIVEHVLDGTPEQVFPFFADASNLQAITPKSLGFQILTPQPIQMAPGTVIDYRIRVWGVPLRWRTVIREWEPPHRFVDDQIRGPYRLWLHEHLFQSYGDGQTLMRDVVTYRAPGPKLLARLLHALVVNRDVARIFEYRSRVIDLAVAQWRKRNARQA